MIPQKRSWIVTRIDGRIASVAADYGHFAEIAGRLAAAGPASADKVSTEKISLDELVALDRTVAWDDLRLFGTAFQKKVWKTLFDLTHGQKALLYSYSDIAVLCDNPLGVRAVAHAVALNPVAYIIPCHLVVPKESMDRSREIRAKAEDSTLFKGSDLYLLDTLDVGDYAYGPMLKRELIKRQME
jgi:O-6-methylguanine DNA methyltransferase